MKKLFCFLAVAATAAFTSCSSDDDNTSNPPVDEVTAINIAANSTSVELGNSITFTVTDQDGDVVNDAVLTVNGETITNPWTPAAVGNYTVTATFVGLSDNIAVTVTEETIEPVEPNNSFVINDVNFETPVTLFGYNTIVETAEGSGEYIIVWDFNPFLEQVEGETATYPNDLYLTLAFPIEPTGEEEGEPTFTIVPPTAGTFTYTSETLPAVLDAWIIANNEQLLPEDSAERAAAIEEVTLNINSLVLAQNEGETSTLEATYTITLTDGTVINGDYNGQTGFYGLPQGRNSNISTGNLINNSRKFSAFRK